jgi:hypothetical protein
VSHCEKNYTTKSVSASYVSTLYVACQRVVEDSTARVYSLQHCTLS